MSALWRVSLPLTQKTGEQVWNSLPVVKVWTKK